MATTPYQFGYDPDRVQLQLIVSSEVHAEIHSRRQSQVWLNQYARGLGPFALPRRQRWGFGHSFIPSHRVVEHDEVAYACPIPVVGDGQGRSHGQTLQRRLASLNVLLKFLNQFDTSDDQQLSLLLSPSQRRRGWWNLSGKLYPAFLISLRQHLYDVNWPGIRRNVLQAEHRLIGCMPTDEFQVEYNPEYRFILGYPQSRVQIDPDLTYETRVRQFTISSDDPVRVMALLAGLGATADVLRRRSIRSVA